jgi:hypothetical protein
MPAAFPVISPGCLMFIDPLTLLPATANTMVPL